MSDEMRDVGGPGGTLPDRLEGVLDKVFSAAQPGSVFGQPVVSGSYTVITASEVTAGGGVGFGRGYGPARPGAGEGAAQPAEPAIGGAGGGGGGGSMGRPVAVVVIGPEGVKVKPVVDVTKLALAGITAWGAMLLACRRYCRPGSR